VLCSSAYWIPSGSTVAGSASGTSGSSNSLLNGPFFVRVDSALNVYVSDAFNNRVMKWPKGSTTGTVAGPQLGYGTGPDTNHLSTPTGLWLDSTESNLYIADSGNCRILKWNIASDNITIVAGGNGCGNASNQIINCQGLYSDR
jgi:sugar lactone lactonase YvrE